MTDLLDGKHNTHLIYQPDATSSISGISTTKNKLLLNVLRNGTSKLYIYTFNATAWTSEQVNAPDYGNLSVVSTDELSDEYFFQFENFLIPETLYTADASTNTFEPFQSLPAYFDADKYKVKQFMATSKDGTKIPYFVVGASGHQNRSCPLQWQACNGGPFPRRTTTFVR